MDLTIFINILGIAVIGNMIAYWFTPIQGAKRWFINLFSTSSCLSRLIDKTLNCPKCISFWVFVSFYQDIIGAALCSWVGLLIAHSIDRIEAWYEQ